MFSTYPQKQENENNNPYIAIVGVDGSGKSSCYEKIVKSNSKKGIAAIGDEVFVFLDGNLVKPRLRYLKLKIFLGKRAKNVKNRTVYKILKLFELILRIKLQNEVVNKHKPKLVITDGSPLINTLAWGNFYRSGVYSRELCEEALGYMVGRGIPRQRKYFFLRKIPEVFLVNFLRIKFQKPDIVFFLKVNPGISLQRIVKRNEERQSHETKEFLASLQNAYGLVCDILKKNTKIITIDTDNISSEEVAAAVYKRIYENN